MNETDLRPIAGDISLCLNTICQNKCKRYYENWKVSKVQSFVQPIMEFDELGNQKKCNLRME